MSWKGILEICSCCQAVENSRQQLLLRTNILQKTVFGCPCYKRELTVFCFFFSLLRCSQQLKISPYLQPYFNDYIFAFFFRSQHFAQGYQALLTLMQPSSFFWNAIAPWQRPYISVLHIDMIYTQCKNGCWINILLFKFKSA